MVGFHHTTINGVDIANYIALTSPSVSIPAGGNNALGPVSQALSGNVAAGLAVWSPASIPLFIRFNGIFGVNTDPQVTFTATPLITSQGVRNVTYTASVIPEPETYFAGLALAGLVGYGFYRRSRRA